MTTELEPHPLNTPTIESEPPAEAPPKPEKETPQSKHQSQMAAIVAKYEKDVRSKELDYGETLAREARQRAAGEEVTDEPPPEEKAVESEGEETKEQEPEARPKSEATPKAKAPETKAPEPKPEPASELTPLEIGGQVLHFTQEQILQLARQGGLYNAALQRGPVQQPQQTPTPQQAPPVPAHGPLMDEETARAMARRLSYGNEDDSTKAIRELTDTIYRQVDAQFRAQQQYPDPQQIARYAAQQAYAQMELNQNLEVIAKEFPQIWENDVLAKTTALQLQAIRQQDQAMGLVRPNLSLYREACQSVMDTIHKVSGSKPQPAGDGKPAPQAAPPVVQSSQREDRKRAAPRPTVAAVSRVPTSATEPRAPTGSEIVNQMRRARGQTPLN